MINLYCLIVKFEVNDKLRLNMNVEMVEFEHRVKLLKLVRLLSFSTTLFFT